MTSQETENEVDAIYADRYRVIGVVGRGGMASVYRAQDELLGRTVALKVFRAERTDAGDVKRQTDEIKLLAALNHPSLVTLFDAVADDAGTAFLVLEFVDGSDLRQVLEKGPTDAATAALLGADIADALEYVHASGVVHRDVKPANILVPNDRQPSTGPRAKLADFGIARLVDGARHTATGSVIGTATYLSPEQALGQALTPATDVYSLGLVLLECLTARRAFPGSALESAAARVTRDPDVPESLPAGWEALLTAMTQREPAARPNAGEVAFMLRQLAAAPAAAELIDPTRKLEPVLPTTASTRILTTTQAAHATEVLPQSQPSPATQSTPATQLLPSPGTSSTSVSGTQGAATAGRRPRRTRRWLIGGGVSVVLVAAIIAVVVTLSTPPPSAPPVQYPAVEGDLGTHLEQLQQTVQR